MKSIMAVAALVLMLVSGCNNNLNQTGSVNLTGNWTISAQSTVFNGLVVSGTGTLQQSGSNVSGNFTLSGTPCATAVALSGTLNGTTFTFQLAEGSAQTVNFTGTVATNGTSASGTYTAPSGGCTNGDTGNWSATKM